MKAGETMLEGLGNLASVTTTGDLRRIVANSMLALARKEIASSDVETLAKGLDSISNSLQAEVKLAKLQIEMRAQGGALGKQEATPGLGQLVIGSTAT
jgi:hypothetical protein